MQLFANWPDKISRKLFYKWTKESEMGFAATKNEKHIACLCLITVENHVPSPHSSIITINIFIINLSSANEKKHH